MTSAVSERFQWFLRTLCIEPVDQTYIWRAPVDGYGPLYCTVLRTPYVLRTVLSAVQRVSAVQKVRAR
jgi:hypothetical protein